MSLTPFTAPKFLCKNSIWDTKGKADVLVNASCQGLVQDQGLYKNRSWEQLFPSSLAADNKELVPHKVSVCWFSLHNSFRWRISQTIRFRKYGMCCCVKLIGLSLVMQSAYLQANIPQSLPFICCGISWLFLLKSCQPLVSNSFRLLSMLSCFRYCLEVLRENDSCCEEHNDSCHPNRLMILRKSFHLQVIFGLPHFMSTLLTQEIHDL